LLSLIDDVLDIAKIEAGHLTLDSVTFDLSDLMHHTVDMMRSRSSAKGLKLLVTCSPMVPRSIRSDPRRIRQLLVNLIGNAIKYTEKGSVNVRLDGKRFDDHRRMLLGLEVEDTGIGIAPQDQARIFEPFIQAGGASDQQGVGLGLSICRQVVNMMGGTIAVRSTPGEGSLFTVEVPVTPVEESDHGPAKEDNYTQLLSLVPGQPEYRILLVEDKKENWLLLQRLLEDAGFKVQVADDGFRGIEMFRTWKPHLIWMDLRLPGMSGIEAARQIRTLPGGRQVKIVALTASAFAQQREEVLAAGLDDFVRKPFRREEIFDCMARHLGANYSYREFESNVVIDSVAVSFTESLAALPQELRKELSDVLVRLDPKPIAKVIERVSEYDGKLADVLGSYAKQYAYTPIFNALKQCEPEPGERPAMYSAKSV
jgi:CheY-like chemotaxis protein